MRASTLWTLLAASSSVTAATSSSLPPRNYAIYDYYAIELKPGTPPKAVALHLGIEYDGPLVAVDDHHVFKAPKHDHDIVSHALGELKAKRRKRDIGWETSVLDSIHFSQKQQLKKRMVKRGVVPKFPQLIHDRAVPAGQAGVPALISALDTVSKNLAIHDPIFNEQWHLFNTVQKGHDLNVTGVWTSGVTGKGSTVCIVDDGLDMYSDDLKDNYLAQGSHDFNDHVDEPRPRLDDDRHGTRCAGEVAAGRNNACGLGVAYDAKVSGVRILSGEISDVDEALAINYEPQVNHIYSCSWGPPDDGRTMQGPGVLIEKAMLKSIQQGRGGKGSIYVFAAGNGAASDDNCNFDGYTNSIYSITVGAIDRTNLHPYYSEKCSAQLVVTYSSGSGDAIHTTDVGTNKCTASHGGTSAAGPLAAGVYALVLEVRPDLSWRDMQWLTVMTALPFDQPSDWQTTKIGKSYSHQFGYGKLDAWAIVEAAKTWKLVKPQAWYFTPWVHVKHAIPQGDQGLASTFDVTAEMLKEANLERLEHMTVTMNVEHTRRGDLSVELRSPNGIVSHLSTARAHDEAQAGYVDWTFMTVAHWGESPIGTWTIVVKDTKVNDHTGTFTDYRIKFWGEAIKAEGQPLLPMPNAHDDDDHDKTTTGSAHTTPIALPTDVTPPQGNPTDHIDRPVNSKPTSSATAPFEKPVGATSTSSGNLLPSFMPTFGVSKSTQGWIYGAMGLILIFCASLGTYLFLARRKRLQNNPHDAYEFEMVNDEDDDAQALNGAAGAKRNRRRAGELYDAFAGESEEELFSDDELEEYHDHVVQRSPPPQYEEKQKVSATERAGNQHKDG